MNVKLFVLFSFLCLMLIPVSFASDNMTDYYFDSNVDIDGNGTLDNPYKTFSNDKITDNSIIHFASGNYSFTNSSSYSNIIFSGKNANETILDGNGYTFNIVNLTVFKNITLTNFKILNNGNLRANNTVFTNLIPTTVNYDNSYGGAIYAPYNKNIFLDNCIFINNTANYGGVIYANGGNVSILNSIFLNNCANSFGGAVVCESRVKLIINNSQFINTISKNGVGGAIYLTSSSLISSNLTISNSSAKFGGAITALSSSLNLTNSNFINNKATYDGGAIYQMYGSLFINSSKFINNTALNGAGLYIDDLNSCNILSSEFFNNTALNCAGAIYSLLVNSTLSNNTFLNNKASSHEDIYNLSNVNLVFGNGNYTMYINNQTQNTTIPQYYNLKDYGHVSPVKDQQSGGNCWAFASLAALESCILKATGDVLDLSEENMKNLMAFFSDYGYNMRYPNGGGTNDLAIAYLASWMGPVSEENNPYDDKSTISPILNSILHVQNILLLKRNNFTDNDAIKQAIMQYGAVATIMYYSSSLIKNNEGKIYQYYNGSLSTNHAVTIVGWDDNIKVNNAPGNGAWIVKNSWGESWLKQYGHDGYFYVSYYDTRFASPGSYSSYTFILNDTLHFDKNYQYDISGHTDFFYIENNTVWYKNLFNAANNEFLAGVSSYFEKNTKWQLTINVNNKFQLTQNGSSNPGYYTINLNNPVPLIKGDVFEVIFKITVDGDVSFPISEEVSLNKLQYYPNVSFISFNGVDWNDLYNFTVNYPKNSANPSHWYTSQVACIKAFTQYFTFNSTFDSLNIDYDSFDLFNITTTIIDGNNNLVGNGNVIFNINGINYTSDVYLGKSTLKTHLVVGQNNISAIFTSPNYNSIYYNTTFNVLPVNLDLIINASQYLNNVSFNFSLSQLINGTLFINVNGDVYSVDIVGGCGFFNLSNLDYGNYTIHANLGSDFYIGENSLNFAVNVKRTEIEISNFSTVYNSGEFFKIKLIDQFNMPLVNRQVKFYLDGNVYTNITDAEGIAYLSINLSNSTYMVIVDFEGDDLYLKTENSSIITVTSSIFLPNSTTYAFNSPYMVYLLNKYGNPLNNSKVIVMIDNVKYDVICINGKAILNIPVQEGSININIINPETNEMLTQTIIVLKRITDNNDLSFYYGKNINYKVRVCDDNGNYISNLKVTFIFNGKSYIRYIDDKGYAYLNLKNTNVGNYVITAEYKGFKISNKIVIKSTIIAKNIKIKKGKTIKFSAKLLNSNGKILKGKILKFKFKGKTYKAKTNKKGIATIKIKNKYKIGKYSILTKYAKLQVKSIIYIKK